MTQPDLSSLALPDSPELKEIEDRVEAYYDDQRNQILESAEQFAADIGTLLDFIAKHLLTAEEAQHLMALSVPVAKSADDGCSKCKALYVKLRALSGSSRGEE